MAEQCPRKSNENSESRCGPIGDDLEPVVESGADVEMGNEEDEEYPVEGIPTFEVIQKNPTSTEKQKHEDSGHAVHSVLLVSKVVVQVDNIELNCRKKRREK